MKIYVSGPISGYQNGNAHAFRAAERWLTERGHVAVVPHDCPPQAHDGDCPRGYGAPYSSDYPEHTSTACFIRGDFVELLRCDAVYMLVNWEYSVGARAEFDVAAVSGLRIFYQRPAAVPDLRAEAK